MSEPSESEFSDNVLARADELSPRAQLPFLLREFNDLVTIGWALMGALGIFAGLMLARGVHANSVSVDLFGHKLHLSDLSNAGQLGVAFGVSAMAIAYAFYCLYLFRLIRRRERWTRVIVLSAISCLTFHTTLLGVATIVLLTRPKIRAQFTDPAS